MHALSKAWPFRYNLTIARLGVWQRLDTLSPAIRLHHGTNERTLLCGFLTKEKLSTGPPPD